MNDSSDPNEKSVADVRGLAAFVIPQDPSAGQSRGAGYSR
jgi:hypothetical protein